ncbi:MAG: DUF421 domain-containing protein [Tissierellia bacterium]|nr:DUF421 domain-containing protein [Tissierellia bacterium]
MFFNNWDSIFKIVISAIFAYISFLILIRISGKRSLAKLNAFDLIVSIALGSIFASTIISDSLPIADGLVAAGVLLLLQFIISKLSESSSRFESLIKAEPSLLYYDGKYIQKSMKKQRVSKREILSSVRSQGIQFLSEVEAVIMETNGNISVIKKSESGDINSLSKSLEDQKKNLR